MAADRRSETVRIQNIFNIFFNDTISIYTECFLVAH